MLSHEAEMELSGGSLSFHKVTAICKDIHTDTLPEQSVLAGSLNCTLIQSEFASCGFLMLLTQWPVYGSCLVALLN